MAKKSKKKQLDEIATRINKLYEKYPQNMKPFIGENYLENRILIVDCCLEVNPDEYEFDNLDDVNSYYSNKKMYHFKESVKEKADADNSLFSLKKVLKALDSNLDKESVIYHSFVIRPIKKNDLFENYFPKNSNQCVGADLLPTIQNLPKFEEILSKLFTPNIEENTNSFVQELTEIDKKESMMMLLRLIHSCRPRLIIFLGTPIYILFFQASHVIKSNDFKLGDTSLKRWIEYSKNQKKSKSFIQNFLVLKSIETFLFNGFIYLKKGNDGRPLYPLQLEENAIHLIDKRGKDIIENNEVHPLYHKFIHLLKLLSLQFFAEVTQRYFNNLTEQEDDCLIKDFNNKLEKFDTTLGEIKTLVKRMLTEELDKDKFDSRANNFSNNTKKENLN